VSKARTLPPTDFCVFISSLTVAIDRQYIERTTTTITTVTRIKLQPDHRESIDAHTDSALSKTGFKFTDDRVRPSFGITIACGLD
jgi:hypothetical protein